MSDEHALAVGHRFGSRCEVSPDDFATRGFRRLFSVVALIAFAVASVHGAELLNADFQTLKSRLSGTWSFTEDGQLYDATFEAVAHGMLFWNAIRGLSPFIILVVFIPCS